MTTHEAKHRSTTPFARALDPDAELRTVPAGWDTSALPAPAPNGRDTLAQASPKASSTAGPVEDESPIRSGSAPDTGYLDEPESAGFHPSHSCRCAY